MDGPQEHGTSGTHRPAWTVGAFATDVVAVCDALAARQLADRVIGLIGVDTWSALGVRRTAAETAASILLPEMRADYQSAARQFARLMTGPAADAELATQIADEVTEMPPHIAIATLEEAIRQGPDDVEQALRELHVPIPAISSATFRPRTRV